MTSKLGSKWRPRCFGSEADILETATVVDIPSFSMTPKGAMKVPCPSCGDLVALRADGKIRIHVGGSRGRVYGHPRNLALRKAFILLREAGVKQQDKHGGGAYGLLGAIARDIGISRERVRQIWNSTEGI